VLGQDTSGATTAVSYLNQERAANGLPAVSLDESLLLPTCTAEDHQIAAGGQAQFTTTTAPWDDAPFHEAALYDPDWNLASFAYYSASESDFGSLGGGDWTCMWFASTATPPQEFYAYTGDEGRVNVPGYEHTAEYVCSSGNCTLETPASELGLGIDAVTGPNLLVWAPGLGDEATVSAVTLQASGGSTVPVISLPWSPATILVPTEPLLPNTSYTATVGWTSGGEAATQSFSFETAGVTGGLSESGTQPGPVKIDVDLSYNFGSPDPTITLTGPTHLSGAAIHDASMKAGQYTWKPTLGAGVWRACATLPAIDAGVALDPACRSFTLFDSPRLKLSATLLRRNHMQYVRLSAGAGAVGRAAKLDLDYLDKQKKGYFYPVDSRLRLRRSQLIPITPPVPQNDLTHQVVVYVSTKRFTLHAIPYAADTREHEYRFASSEGAAHP
jgi:hypothetical protein